MQEKNAVIEEWSIEKLLILLGEKYPLECIEELPIIINKNDKQR